MFIPQSYGVALIVMLLSMLCWGSWANTQKLCSGWRFELFYWDYVWGMILVSLLLGFTVGDMEHMSPDSFLNNLRTADERHLLLAFGGGFIFNVSNILLVAAIRMAGLAVAVPIGIGFALVLGSGVSYIITPKGNPLFLFGGIGLICAAILLNALAYWKLSHHHHHIRTKGIVLSLLAGVGIGLSYPFIAEAIQGENRLGPYTVAFVFFLGILACTIPMNLILMRRPILGLPLTMSDYFRGGGRMHAWGILGGVICGLGSVSNFIGSYAHMVGPATSFAIGQGGTMVSALWGVFVWREFEHGPPGSRHLLVYMFIFFILGLSAVAVAPVMSFHG